MAYGFRPNHHLTGGTVRTNAVSNSYTIESGYSTSLFLGDPVSIAAGYLVIGAPGSNTRNLGVFAGVVYKASDGAPVYSKYWPASTVATEIEAMVWDDPNIVFAIESDQVGTALTFADVGSSMDATAGAGSTVTGLSGWFLDSSGGAGATAAQLKILGSAEQDGTFTGVGSAMDVLVMFNEHIWSHESAGVA